MQLHPLGPTEEAPSTKPLQHLHLGDTLMSKLADSVYIGLTL
jgi:hypothetical protein